MLIPSGKLPFWRNIRALPRTVRFSLQGSYSSPTKDQKSKELSHPDFFAAFCSSREFLKIFSNSGTEIFPNEECFEDQQSVVELQFGEGNFVTLQTQLDSRESRLKLHFVVLRRSLHSGMFWESLFPFCFILFCFVFFVVVFCFFVFLFFFCRCFFVFCFCFCLFLFLFVFVFVFVFLFCFCFFVSFTVSWGELDWNSSF